MLRPFLVASLLILSAPAFADAGPPGACECAAPVAPAPSLPRFGVGLHATSLSTRPAGDTAVDPIERGGGGLQLRYRVAPRWELGLALDHLEAKDQSAPALDLATLDLRFHLAPYRRWDGYLLAGIGSAADPAQDGVKPDGQAELGAGIERRFHHLALSAELRAIRIVPHHDGAAARMEVATPTPPADPTRTVGGGLTLAATYYF